MALSHLFTLFFLLLLIPYYASSISFDFPKIGPELQNVEIIPEGDGAYISDTGIQITPDGIGSDRRQKAGRATYRTPFHLWDKRSNELASFSTNFSFVIDSVGSYDYGDGLTFFLAQTNSVITRGGAMGLPVNATTIKATNPFVAVEFDTFPNKDWDPRDSNNVLMRNHVGISVNSLTSVKYERWFSNIIGGRECQASITYDSVSQNLSVSFTGFRNNTMINQTLHYIIDLRTVLPERVLFGFSAATGSSLEKNSVLSWSFGSSDLPDDC